MSDHYVYILECQGGRYYTGYSTDVQRRYQQHVERSAKCKFTRSFPPLGIAAVWTFANKTEALQMEYAIKRMTRAQKVRLIAEQSTQY